MRRRLLTVLALGLLLASRELRAGDPLGAFRVEADSRLRQISPAAALDPDGNLLAVWWTYTQGSGSVLAGRFTPDGRRLGGLTELAGDTPILDVSADAGGYTVMMSSSYNAFLSRLDRAGVEVGGGTLGYMGATSLASDGRNRTVAVGQGFGGGSGLPEGILAFPLVNGRPVGGPLRISRLGTNPDVAMDSAGRFTVVWSSGNSVFGQRLTAAGKPAGPRFRVGPSSGNLPRIAASPDGRFAVVWPAGDRLLLRLYAANGSPRTPEPIEVANDPYTSFDSLVIAMDDAGEILVAWSAWTPDEGNPVLRGRFYSGTGSPAGPAFTIVEKFWFTDELGTLSISGGRDGRFAAVWEDESLVDGSHVYARWLPWSPAGDAACLYAAGTFSCDLRHDEGAAELVERFGGEPGDVPLWGDVGRLGRDRPCVYRSGRFLCAPPAGQDAPWSVTFGAAGDVPLLGDLDGDGRDDACVFRNGDFLCDTAHDGGDAEVVVHFGHAGDVPLLGDLDGDGDDDPCVVEGGSFLCDTAHTGRAAVSIPLAVQPGDVPLLGDLNGDGLADPCVYRDVQFLCDPAHIGSLAMSVFFSGPAGAVPRLADPAGVGKKNTD